MGGPTAQVQGAQGRKGLALDAHPVSIYGTIYGTALTIFLHRGPALKTATPFLSSEKGAALLRPVARVSSSTPRRPGGRMDLEAADGASPDGRTP